MPWQVTSLVRDGLQKVRILSQNPTIGPHYKSLIQSFRKDSEKHQNPKKFYWTKKSQVCGVNKDYGLC